MSGVNFCLMTSKLVSLNMAEYPTQCQLCQHWYRKARVTCRRSYLLYADCLNSTEVFFFLLNNWRKKQSLLFRINEIRLRSICIISNSGAGPKHINGTVRLQKLPLHTGLASSTPAGNIMDLMIPGSSHGLCWKTRHFIDPQRVFLTRKYIWLRYAV